MSAPARVFHHGPKPVSLIEFRDALEAVCLPRFPTVRFARPRRVGTSKLYPPMTNSARFADGGVQQRSP